MVSVFAMAREIEVPADGVAPMGLQKVSHAFFVGVGVEGRTDIYACQGGRREVYIVLRIIVSQLELRFRVKGKITMQHHS